MSILSIPAREKDLGGFSVRRLLPFHQRQKVGPFIFFDHLGPAHFPKGEGVDVRPHPHIGLATVTYLFEGELLHRDSLGNEMTIQSEAINLMVAGKGIVHSERSPDSFRQKEGQLHALQLWLALPKDQEECEPAFHHYAAESLPIIQKDGLKIRVMIGEAYGQISPVKTFCQTLYVEIKAQEDTVLQLPEADELAAYMVEGNAFHEGETLKEHHLTILPSGQVELEAGCHLVLIGGEKLAKRHIFWNLVSSDPDKIEQAKQVWQAGHFPKVPGETEFIPLPKN